MPPVYDCGRPDCLECIIAFRRRQGGLTMALDRCLAGRPPRTEAECLAELHARYDGPVPRALLESAAAEGRERRVWERDHPIQTALNAIAIMEASIPSGLKRAAELKTRADDERLNLATRTACAKELREIMTGIYEAAGLLSQRWRDLRSLLSAAMDQEAA